MRPARCIQVACAAVLSTAATAAATTPAVVALPAHHPSSVLVTFSAGAGASERAAVHRAVGGRVASRFGELRTDVVALPDGVRPIDAVARYRGRAGVTGAVLNKRVRMLSAPDDLQFGDQWGFHNTGQSVTASLVRGKTDFDIDAPEAWDAAFGPGRFESSGGTRVAVLDTGIERGHVEFVGKIKACASAVTGLGIITEGTCSDDNLHGTHTAGTVGALTDNTTGVAGTAPNAELAIFKFLDAAGFGFVADEIAGVRWARTTAGAKVMSMSFSAYEPDGAEQQAFKDAAAAGILLVAAAGNDGDATQNYPAAYGEVMSVASTRADDDVSDFSTCNADVEVGAPGEDIWSTFPGNAYGVISGTSMATPHVAGAGALIMSERGFSAAQARSALKSTATPVTGDNGRAACSSVTQINLAAALGGGSAPPPAGPGAITGTVTDAQSKAGLATATVSCGAAGSATTGGDGRYGLSPVPSGTYTCTASKPGYRSKSTTAGVAPDATTTADFALRATK